MSVTGATGLTGRGLEGSLAFANGAHDQTHGASSGRGCACDRAVDLAFASLEAAAGADDVGRFLGALPNLDALRLTWQPLETGFTRRSAADAGSSAAVGRDGSFCRRRPRLRAAGGR
jgi:hypothetical protein